MLADSSRGGAIQIRVILGSFCSDQEMELGFGSEKKAGTEVDDPKWVHDSSVDHRGRIPHRASTGSWRAALFIIGIEFSERMSYFGIASNLIIYLTKVIGLDIKIAAKNVNYWAGVTSVMALFGGFIADAYMGRFWTVLASSIIYLLGLCLLTISEFVPSLKPQTCTMNPCNRTSKVHEAIFFVALYMVSVGTGGHKPSLESFGADQFDEEDDEERTKKMSYFNWWNFGLCCGLLVGVTVIVYVQDFVSWGVADIIVVTTMGISILVFLLGMPFYRYRVPKGSPLTPLLQVLVAAVVKRNLPCPLHPSELYEVPKSKRNKQRLLCHTNNLRFLDKAAIVEESDDKENEALPKKKPWRLATVTQVEETKLVLRVVPIWLSNIMFGVCVAQGTTFFIKQGSTMNRNLGPNFKLPPASIYSFSAVAIIASISFYDRVLVPMMRRLTGNERGISMLQRIGTGMVFSILAMVLAAMIETKRLGVAERELLQGKHTKEVSMSVFWLAPQYIILGIADAFTLVGLQEYFYDQVPDSMRSLGIAFYLSVLGLSNFVSSLLITVTDHLSSIGGRRSWFASDLNKSHLDYFYWLIASLTGVNLCIFVFLASRYSYKSVEKRVAVADSYDRDDAKMTTHNV